ncbi:hypothetical protein QBC41DRAFT_318385 [Cercophora samala]|uniref:Uncharacterized protein n=1 Tax=Cercophora samala TaxID=330535 RepID=A0AA40DDL0_9PEZI|nr:hypothetical protein QBC41DRAFT_318385 [Cercophora samala]
MFAPSSPPYHHLQHHQFDRTMNPPYYSSRAGVRGKRSSGPSTCTCRSRRRGCGRTLPACPNCRRQGQESGMTSWHRGNDGRLVARGGHQRGILSVRSRKVDLANKRAGHHPVKKHSFILSLPRGLSLARLVRGDKSCYRQKNGDLPLSVSFPLSDGEDLEMTDLYELLVKMSLCEEEAMQQQEQQFEALSLPCVEIDMEDEFPAVFQREATPPPESSSEPASVSSSTTSSASSSLATTPEVDPQGETSKDGSSHQAEPEAEIKSEDAIEQTIEEEPASKPEPTGEQETDTPITKSAAPPQSLLNILHPLHQSTPLNETDLATMLNWLLQPDIFSHLSVQSSSAKSSFTTAPKDDDTSPFPSTDHFLQIMEVISQLTAKVLMRPSPANTDAQQKEQVEITAEHLSVIMNLRLLLDYAARVLCIRSIETQNSTSAMDARSNALQVV